MGTGHCSSPTISSWRSEPSGAQRQDCSIATAMASRSCLSETASPEAISSTASRPNMALICCVSSVLNACSSALAASFGVANLDWEDVLEQDVANSNDAISADVK